RRFRIVVFFFQAEDGIRDATVTGVQTCALPISTSAVATLTISPTNPPLLLAPVDSPDKNYFSFSLGGETGRFYRIWATTNLVNRSEERRVGKEWRRRWSKDSKTGKQVG